MGLAEQIRPASAASKTRYIVGHDGRMHAVPKSLLSAITSPLTKSMPFWLLRDVIWPASSSDRDLTIDEFFRPRIGPNATDLLASALAAGIYAGDSKRLSMRSCLPSIPDMVIEHRSLLRGLIKTAMAKPALPPLPKVGTSSQTSNLALMNQAVLAGLTQLGQYGRAPGQCAYVLIRWWSFDLNRRPVEFGAGIVQHLGADQPKGRHSRPVVIAGHWFDEPLCQAISVCPRTLDVVFDNGSCERYDDIFWTGSAGSMASALHGSKEASHLTSSLSAVHYASIAVVTLAWGADAVRVPEGFGVLVPDGIPNAPSILGITFDSQTFPSQFPKGRRRRLVDRPLCCSHKP